MADHFLLPHQADWRNPPKQEKLWRGAVDRSLTGAEDRVSVRGNSWIRFSYSVLPFNQIERSLFEYRFKRALKAGKVAVPHWGRGSQIPIQMLGNETSITLAKKSPYLTAGVWCFIQSSVPSEFDVWDIAKISSVANQITLHLAGTIENRYPAGTYVWPLLFGRPIAERFAPMNLARGEYRVHLLFDQRSI